MSHIYTWQDCTEFNIEQVQELYRQYVSKSQVSLIGSFGFGRTVATSSQGMYIQTADGRDILDFTGGVGVLSHGHNHPRILKARKDFQEQQRMEVHKNFLSQYVAGLSHNIAQLLPEDLNISYFCNSGAEAVEGAVKLAHKYHDGARRHILHADISFHGKLLGSAGLTGSPELDREFPTIPNIVSFEFNKVESIKKAVGRLRKTNGESDIYAIILEPFSASSLRECTTEFLKELRSLCSNEDIVLIFDEVYSGWAKTGELFNFMKHDVVPDIVTMSKSFGGGKSSISCYTSRDRFFRKAYDNLNDATLHSTTYNGFGEECVTAMESLKILVEEDYVGKSRRIYERLNKGLRQLQDKHPDFIQEVRGSGSLNGIILNQDMNIAFKMALKFLPGDLFEDKRFMAKLINSAVISELFNTHGILTFFGSNTDILLITSPSLIVTDSEIDQFLIALDETLAVGKMTLVLKFAQQKFLRRP